MPSLQNVANFNSIKVQLKPELYEVGHGGCEFQFHKGTIKTLLIILTSIQIVNFNSIKVQLKQYNC